MKVPSQKLTTLLGHHEVSHVDLFQVDAEGFDYEILKMLFATDFRPSIVSFENTHLSPADKRACALDLAAQIIPLHLGRARHFRLDGSRGPQRTRNVGVEIREASAGRAGIDTRHRPGSGDATVRVSASLSPAARAARTPGAAFPSR